MYVFEKGNNWHNYRCYWVENPIADIQERLAAMEDAAGLYAVWTCEKPEDAIPENKKDKYEKAICTAVNDYIAAGKQLPATVVAHPGRKPGETYEVWTAEEAADFKKWEALLDEWTAKSGAYDYGIHPYYFDDDKAVEQWKEWNDADAAAAIAKAADIRPYVVRKSGTKNFIGEFYTYEEAAGTVIEREDYDRENGSFKTGSYEIFNTLTNKVVG